jgi:hypothetical protein
MVTDDGTAPGAAAPTGMHLNHVAPDGGGGTSRLPSPSLGKDVASSPAEKKAAAKAIEEHLEPDTSKAGTRAKESTGAASKEFGPSDGEGWLTGQALKTAQETWSRQLTTLMNRLGSEKAALRSTGTLFQKTDLGVAHAVRQPSALDSF